MAGIEVKVKITDMDLFTRLIDVMKDAVLDSRMPGDLANEIQYQIGAIIKECAK
mgnify:CR=1 FL=1